MNPVAGLALLLVTTAAAQDRVRVLYVEGSPSWDYRFIKNGLKRSKEFDLQVFLLSADQEFVQEHSEGLAPLRSLPRTGREFARYDVLLVGDVTLDQVGGTGWWDSVVGFVRRGGGVALFPGIKAMGTEGMDNGNYDTRLLPVVVDGPPLDGSWRPNPLAAVVPVFEKRLHPILRLAESDAESRAMWRSFFHSHFVSVDKLKSGSEALLRRADGPILAATGGFGRGRTFFLGTSDSWMWRRNHGAPIYDRFWHNVVRHVSRQRTSPNPEYRGPFVGHVTDTTVDIWMRAPGEQQLGLLVSLAGKPIGPIVFRAARRERDHCVRWRVEGLGPDTEYRYSVLNRTENHATPLKGSFQFKTAPRPGSKLPVRIAFGSCAREDSGTAATWIEIDHARPDALVLLGDTPYIDSTGLAKQRSRYRAFAGQPALARLLSHTPWYGTWDDHDFGRDGATGELPDKANSRQAFLEYHANPTYGTGVEGIYTRFRRGPVEVFLLDARWFAGTEPSPFDPKQPTLLGKQQWQWLENGLQASTAAVKVLASGMIFNDAVRPNKPDYWGRYPHERRALFEMIGRNKIRGVVLVSGDIHRSRVVRHGCSEFAGYDITELITSPLHAGIIKSANAPHPGLIKDMGSPNTFLLLEVDGTGTTPIANATFIRAGGEIVYQHWIRLR